MDFATLQGAFQKAILEGDDAVLAEILDSPRESRTVLFGVYRNAYAQRLVDALAAEFPTLRAALGDDGFDDAARAYLAAHPSEHPSVRWIGARLPGFLASTEPFAAQPALAEIAALECALSDAFDAADSAVLALADLAAVAPEDWGRLRFEAHPSARRLDLATNAASVWSAVADGEPPPAFSALDEPDRVIVWRQDVSPMMRSMTAEEAMLWDEAARGHDFALLCAMAATYADPENAAGRAAGHLVGWIHAGLLSGAALGG